MKNHPILLIVLLLIGALLNTNRMTAYAAELIQVPVYSENEFNDVPDKYRGKAFEGMYNSGDREKNELYYHFYEAISATQMHQILQLLKPNQEIEDNELASGIARYYFLPDEKKENVIWYHQSDSPSEITGKINKKIETQIELVPGNDPSTGKLAIMEVNIRIGSDFMKSFANRDQYSKYAFMEPAYYTIAASGAWNLTKAAAMIEGSSNDTILDITSPRLRMIRQIDKNKTLIINEIPIQRKGSKLLMDSFILNIKAVKGILPGKKLYYEDHDDNFTKYGLYNDHCKDARKEGAAK